MVSETRFFTRNLPRTFTFIPVSMTNPSEDFVDVHKKKLCQKDVSVAVSVSLAVSGHFAALLLIIDHEL